MITRDTRRIIRAQRDIAAGVVVALLLAWAMWQLRDLLVLVAFAVLLAYVLDPLVSALERIPLPYGERLPRAGASAIVMVVLVALLAWGGSLAAPRLVAELGDFVASLPARLDELIRQVHRYAARQGLSGVVDPALQNARLNSGGAVQALGSLVAQWVGRLAGSVAQVIGLLVLPLLTFYLLAEREDVMNSMLAFAPADRRIDLLRRAVDRALRSYVRGQAIVCLVMGTVTGVALALLGFPLALLLGVIVGLAEVVPYLGFIAAALAIAVAGIGGGALHAVAGVVAYAVINQVIGLLVTPRVMGRYLKVHPFVVTVSILAGGQLLGPAGALLALPVAASVQAVVTEVVRAREIRRAARRARARAAAPKETD